jgi:hypothetical protein
MIIKELPMKKGFVFLLVLLSVLALGVSVAAAQPAASKTARLWSVQYNDKGLQLTFTVAGFDKRSDLSGSITVDKKSVPLKCKFDDIKTVKCSAQNMNRYDGLNARIWFGGFVFYHQLPFLSD